MEKVLKVSELNPPAFDPMRKELLDLISKNSVFPLSIFSLSGDLFWANDYFFNLFKITRKERLRWNDFFKEGQFPAEKNPDSSPLLRATELNVSHPQNQGLNSKEIQTEVYVLNDTKGKCEGFFIKLYPFNPPSYHLKNGGPVKSLFTAFENASVGILLLDEEDNLVDCNANIPEILGYSREKLIGKSIRKLIHPYFREEMNQKLEQLYAGETASFEMEVRYLNHEYKYKWVSVFISLLFEENNRYRLVFVTDIGKRKEAEIKNLKGEVNLKLAQRMAKIGQWEIDLKNLTLNISPELSNLLSLPTDTLTFHFNFKKLIETTFRQSIEEESKEKIESAINDAIEKHQAFDLEVDYLPTRGAKKWFRLIGKPILHHQKVYKLTGVIQDISGLKEAQLRNEQSEIRYKTFADNFPNGTIIILDKNLNYKFIAGKELGKMGFTPANFAGKSIYDFQNASILEITVPNYKASFEGEVRTFELDYNQQYYLYNSVPLTPEKGEIKEILVVSQNITERKINENKIKVLLKETQKLNDGLRKNEGELIKSLESIFKLNQRIKENEANLSALINNIDTYIFSVNAQFEFITCNNKFSNYIKEKLGVDILPGMHIFDILPNFMVKYLKPRFQKAFSGEIWTEELLDKKVNNWLEVSYHPIFQEENSVAGVTVSARNITERKLAEKQIQTNEAYLKAILDNTIHSFILIDRDFKILALNKESHFRSYDLYRINVEVGDDFRKAIPVNTLDSFTNNFEKALQGDVVEFVKYTQNHSNEEIWFKYRYAPAYDAKGNIFAVTFGSTDISDLKKSEEAIKLSEAKLLSLINNTQDFIWALDKDLRYLAFNISFEKIMLQIRGVCPKIGDVSFSQTDSVAIREQYLGYYNKALKGEQFTVEYPLSIDSTNEILNIEASFSPIKSESGEIIGFCVFARDITARRKAEEEVVRSRANLQALIENTSDLIWAVDENLNYMVFNSSYEEFIYQFKGKKPVIGQPYLTGSSNSGEEQNDISYYQRALEGMRSRFEQEIYLANKVVFTESYFNPIKNELGNIIGVSVFGRDISHRKKVEFELLKREKLLNSMVSSQTNFLIRIDLEGRYTFANESYLKKFNLAFDQIIGTDFPAGLMEEDRLLWQKTAKECTLYPGKVNIVEIRQFQKEGSYRDVEWEFIGIQNEKSKVAEIQGVGKDVTERKKTEQALLEAKHKAEEMNRLKSNFLANMSHEIRTPLNGILGISQIIEEEENLEEIRQYIQLQKKSGERLLNTLTSILNLSRLEAEKTNFDLQVLDINKLIDEITESLQALAQSKGIYLKQELSFGELHCLADETLLFLILNNIIGNAIKFTHNGGVLVNASFSAINEKFISITIKDTGIGISRDFMHKIFIPFEQESSGQKRAYEGSGLGLSIAKKYVELLGGHILVESEKDKGSVFEILLPHYQI